MANSLFCASKLWDSANSILGFTSIQNNNSLISIDKHKIQCWRYEKLFKCIVHGHDLKEISFKGIFAFDRLGYRLVLLVFSVVSSSLSATGGFIEIWTESLSHIQRIDLDYPPVSFTCVSRDQRNLCLGDKNGNIIVLNINSKSTTTKSKEKIQLTEVQIILPIEGEEDEEQTAEYLDNGSLAVWNNMSTSLRIFNIESIAVTEPERDPSNRYAYILDTIIDLNAKNEDTRLTSISQRSVQVQVQVQVNTDITSSSSTLSVPVLVTMFSDGLVMVFAKHIEGEGYVVVCRVQLHEGAGYGIKCCPWKYSSNNESSFDFEVVSYGESPEIVHTGFTLVGQSASYQIIGVYNSNRTKTQNKRVSHVNKRRNIVVYETCSNDNTISTSSSSSLIPSQRMLVYSHAEFVIVLKIHMQCAIVKNFNNTTVTHVSGFGADPRGTEEMFALLKDQVVDIYDKTGASTKSFYIDSNKPIRNAKETLDKNNNNNNNSTAATIRYMHCGDPKVVHACLLSQKVYVGFSTGNISCSSMKAGYLFSSEFLDLFDDVHGSSMSALATCEPIDTIEVEKGDEAYVFLIAADMNGTISVTKVNSKSDHKLHWFSNSHTGQVVRIQALQGNYGHVFLSASSNGSVKLWAITKTTVSLISFLTSLQSPLSYALCIHDTSGDLYILCGFSNGHLESWIMSTSRKRSCNDAVCDLLLNESSVIFIKSIQGPVIQQGAEPSSSSSSSSKYFLCSYVNGFVCALEMNKDGLLQPLKYFTFPVSIYFISSELKIATFLNGILRLGIDSSNKHNSTSNVHNSNEDAMSNDIDEEVECEREDKDEGQDEGEGECEGNAVGSHSSDSIVDDQTSMDDSAVTAQSMKSLKLSVKPTKRLSNKAIANAAASANANANDSSLPTSAMKYDHSKMLEFSAYMKNVMDDMFAVEYYKTVKNAQLIQLYRHADGSGKGIPAAEAAMIISDWVNDPRVFKENVIGLMKTLGINLDVIINYEKVAKIATVFSSFLKPTKKMEKTFESYPSMRLATTKVIYNELGEATRKSITLPDGLHTGSYTDLRKLWNTQESRLHLDISQQSSPHFLFTTQLRIFPESFSGLLKPGKTVLPVKWSFAQGDGCRPDVIIKIGRQILDQRFEIQHNAYHLYTIDRHNNGIVDSFPKLLTDIYVKNYGSLEFSIAQQRVLMFLESCIQFAYCPIINILKSLLLPDYGLKKWDEESVWLLIEVRGSLLVNQAVHTGRNFDFSEIDNFASQESIQIVNKQMALRSVVEVLKLRGGFGPHFIDLIVSKLASIDSALSAELMSQYEFESQIPGNISDEGGIDFEIFLETLVLEFMHAKGNVLEYKFKLIKDIKGSANQGEQIIDFISTLIHADPNRRGTASVTAFRDVMHRYLITNSTSINRGTTYECDNLMNECIKRYSLFEDLNHMVSYVDMIATVISWHCNNRSMKGTFMTCAGILDIMDSSKLGMEHEIVPTLVSFLGMAKANVIKSPYWVCQKLQTFALPTDGNWHYKPINEHDQGYDNMVSMLVSGSNFQLNDFKQVQLKYEPPPPENQTNQSALNVVPCVMPTVRSLETLRGETCSRKELLPKALPALRLLDMAAVSALEYSPDRLSYSRSLSSLPAEAARSPSSSSKSNGSTGTRIVKARSKARSGSAMIGSSLDAEFSMSKTLETNYSVVSDIAEQQLKSLNGEEDKSILLIGQELQYMLNRRSVNKLMKHAKVMDIKASNRRLKQNLENIKKYGNKSSAQFRDENIGDGKDNVEDELSRTKYLQSAYENLRLASTTPKKREQKPKTPSPPAAVVHTKAEVIKIAIPPPEEQGLHEEPFTYSPDIAMNSTVSSSTHQHHHGHMQKHSPPKEIFDAKEMSPWEIDGNDDLNSVSADNTETSVTVDESQELVTSSDDINIDNDVDVEDYPNQEVVENDELDNDEEDENDEPLPDDTVDDPPIPIPAADANGNEEGEGNNEISNDLLAETLLAAQESEALVFENMVVEKLRQFVVLMDDCCTVNARHPRRKEMDTVQTQSGLLFIPQMFGSDISFNAFESNIPQTSSSSSRMDTSRVPVMNEGVEQGEASPRNLFAGIGKRVKAHRKAVEKQRMEQLYSTSDTTVSTAEWTKIFVNGKVDWKKFLSDEKGPSINSPNPNNTNDITPLHITEENVSIIRATSNLPSPLQSLASNNSNSASVARDQQPKDDVILPMPNGKILKIAANKGDIKYFYILSESTCKITVDITCKEGSAVVLIGTGYIPNSLKYDFTYKCSTQAPTHISIDAFNTKKLPSILAIEHMEDAKYSIWKYSSEKTIANGDAEDPLKQTSKIIEKLNFLSSFDVEDLHVSFPRIERESLAKVASESALLLDKKGEKAVVGIKPGKLPTDETAALESAILERGRYSLKSNPITRSGAVINPNQHADLFPKIKLPKAIVSNGNGSH